VGRRQPLDPVEEGGLVVLVPTAHPIPCYRALVRGARHQRVSQNRLDLGGHNDGLQPPATDEEGFLPESVARHQHRPRVRIPKREGEHAVEARQRCLAPLRERGEQNFGVAVGAKRPTLLLELAPEILVIVDFTVVDEVKPAIARRHRLIGPARGVEDRQTPMRQRHAPAGVEPRSGTVGAAMDEAVAHRREQVLAYRYRR